MVPPEPRLSVGPTIVAAEATERVPFPIVVAPDPVVTPVPTVVTPAPAVVVPPPAVVVPPR